jgi:hypothetical protein
VRKYILEIQSTVLSEYLRERQLQGSFADYLFGVTERIGAEVEDMIRVLNPSANALRGILVLVEEISRKERISLSEVFSSSSLSNVLLDDDIPRKEKIKRIRDILERRRYPEKSRLEDMIKNCSDTIRKKYNLRVIMPDELEGDSIEIKISGRSPEDIHTAAGKLQSLSESEELAALFGILRGDV